MGFIERFFQNNGEITLEDVSSFISQRIEENLNLDYKDIQAYHDPNKLAINVASFANAEGGLIILGVAENQIRDDKGRIERVHPGKITLGDVSLDKEKLENQLIARIQPFISGLVVKPVRDEKNRVIFLIDIPKSNSAPHMSSDHVYHRRMNFRISTMEHYEVSNLFRINWTMKQKLVENIYEPLVAVLEKHVHQLGEYHCPDRRDIEDIMSRTYYKAQMPFETIESIDYYIEQLENLEKEEYFARESVIEIASRNITDYLREKKNIVDKEFVVLDYVSVNTKPRKHEVKLDAHLTYSLLLANLSVNSHVSKAHWRDVFEEITISYGAETHHIDLHDFDELVWSKCLKEASENTRIIRVKKDAKAISEEAWALIEEVIKS